ncbi:MAG: RsbRD N-terminal domain-containing protein [Proteobacteria bacterium]|nr:RsbRD N-terminal domain-containing protein [Pseudomonadota bacterium]
MGFRKHLEKYRPGIIDNWFKSIVATYPPEAKKLFSNQSDSFNNPVGSTTLKSLENVFDALLNEMAAAEIKKRLDPVIRIRAVQEFTPTQALYFILDLKRVVRDVLKKELKAKDHEIQKGLQAFESQIDILLFTGFEIYMGCREQIYSYKANHVKDRTLRLLKKANLLCEVPEVGTEIIPHNVYKNGGFDDTKT